MKKMVSACKNYMKSILELFSKRDMKGMSMLSISLLLSYLWPLIGLVCIAYTKMKKQYKDYGKVALLGVSLNIVTYILQITIRVCQQI